MKIKTAEATGPALDWLVAKCDGLEFDEDYQPIWFEHDGFAAPRAEYHPSTDWSQGGPIIEREGISLVCLFFSPQIGHIWQATTYRDDQIIAGHGPTALIAAMRCHVASELGDEVEIPEKLT